MHKYSCIMLGCMVRASNTILIRIIDTEDLMKTTTTISGENKLLEYVKFMTTSSHQMSVK